MLGKSSRWRSVIAWDGMILLTTGGVLFDTYNLESSKWGVREGVIISYVALAKHVQSWWLV